MAEIFVHSGEDSGSGVAPAPRLQGIFVPGIDTPDIQDGFGLVTPLGGGATTRQYTQYGVSNVISAQETQLHNLTINPAEGQTFNLEGLLGPQGIQGTPGIDGITTLLHLYGAPNSSFLTALPNNIDQIDQLGTTTNVMLYVSSYDSTFNFVWAKTDIDSVVKSWNDSGINTDGSFLIVAADAGIYVSTDDGDSWDKYNPDSDEYEQINCEASGGDAVALGTSGKDRGAILVTNDYGVNWSEVTVTV